MSLYDNIPSLAMVSNEDGTITLEQYVCGNAERVAVHPVHVRHLAEKLGMVRALSASDAELLWTERGHVTALRQENDRLKRSMLRLHAHALALQKDFRENADWTHADLAHEMSSINALVDLFDMAVDDFADDYTAHDPGENPPVTQVEPTGLSEGTAPATRPKTDGFETPPKTGGLGVASDVTPCHAMSRHVTPCRAREKSRRRAGAVQERSRSWIWRAEASISFQLPVSDTTRITTSLC